LLKQVLDRLGAITDDDNLLFDVAFFESSQHKRFVVRVVLDEQ